MTVPDNAPLTQPYYLQQPRQGDWYPIVRKERRKRSPLDPPLLRATVTLDIAGTAIDVVRPVEFRYAVPVRGELRTRCECRPARCGRTRLKLLVVPLGTTASQQRVLVRTRTFSTQPANGTLRLRLPSGWTSAPAEARFTLRSVEDRATTPFTVTAPAGRTAGSFEIGVEAVVNGTSYTRDVQEIAYPHIQTHRLYWPATLTAQVVDLKVAPVKVGYVMGSGDQVPDALRQMGFSVTLIDDETLADGDLSLFDTIVVGIRASEARPAFVANHDRLLQYVTQGGTLIVQYQQGDYVTRKLPPFPVGSSANSRVVDETAPVRILAPEHPVLTFPNRIAAADFSGWVQERNLWAFTNFDRRYTALLETGRSGRSAADRRRSVCRDRKGPLRVHSVRVVPTVAGRSARSVQAIRKPGVPVESATLRCPYESNRSISCACSDHGAPCGCRVGDVRWSLRRERAAGRADRRSARARQSTAQAGAAHRRAQRLSVGARQANAERDLNKLDIRMPQPKIHTDIPRLRPGASVGSSGRCTSPPTCRDRSPFAPHSSRSTSSIGWFASIPTRSSWRIQPATWSEYSRQGRIASLIGMEGGHSIDNSLGDAAHVARSGRPIHDPDPQHQHTLGRFGHGQAEAWWPIEIRRGGRARDESARHAGRSEPHVPRDNARRDSSERSARHLFSLRCARSQRPWPQRPR